MDYFEIFQAVGEHEFLGYGFQRIGDHYLHRGELLKAAKAYSLSLQYDDVNYELKCGYFNFFVVLMSQSNLSMKP